MLDGATAASQNSTTGALLVDSGSYTVLGYGISAANNAGNTATGTALNPPAGARAVVLNANAAYMIGNNNTNGLQLPANTPITLAITGNLTVWGQSGLANVSWAALG
jgi:hypothetical protein